MALSTEQVIEITKMALDFAKTAVDAGKDPVAATRARLIDIDPLVKNAQGDIDDLAKRKFGG